MNSFSRKIILGSLMFTLLGGSAWAQGHVGTIDLNKVFAGYWKTKQAEAVLKDRATDMDKDYRTMVTDFEKAKDDYQKLVASASDQAVAADERDKRKKSAEDKLRSLNDTQESLNQFRRTAAAQMDEQKRRMRENILTEIRNVVNAKAKTAAYSLVVDTSGESAGGAPIVLYNDNSSDLTEAVLQQLNAGAPADATTTATPASTEKKDEKKKK